MKINHFGVNQSPNKRPIPRDMPHDHKRGDLKYRIHKYYGRWYLCDTRERIGDLPPRQWPLTPKGDYMTSEGRYCRDLHYRENGYATFARAHAAYLSQIS